MLTLLLILEENYAVSVHSSHPGWTCSVMEHGTCKNVYRYTHKDLNTAILRTYEYVTSLNHDAKQE